VRQHFTPYTAAEKRQWQELKKLMDDHGMTRSQAGAHLCIPAITVGRIMGRSYPSPLEMRERRKNYIIRAMTDPKRKQRTSPYLISQFFMIDETFVEQMIQELRNEGRLPRGDTNDAIERTAIIRMLQKHHSNVYRAATVGKEKTVGDKLYVAGKGWMAWPDAAALADSYKK
jgi:hypothetical protein